MNSHIKIIMVQVIFLAVVFIAIYFLYPRMNLDIEGNNVNFRSINSNVIMLSENPDFSNPRYIDIKKDENISFNLKPGKYYWRSSNSIIEGLKKEFEIKSEVGLAINKTKENESELVNIGDVKINVTKIEGGIMVGHIILEPDESEKIENKDEKYEGRQG